MDAYAATEAPAKPDALAITDRQPSELGEVELLALLNSWWQLDFPHCSKWHAQAKKDQAFAVGKQWEDNEIATLQAQKRAPTVFNRTLIMLKAVGGIEINSRHQIVFLPRGGVADERGRIKVKANETLSAASKWMDDTADAEDHQSAAFQDTCKTGMGWTEPLVGYDDDPQGLYYEKRVPGHEMVWDYRAREKNLTDAQRLWRAKRMLRSEARARFPDAAPEDLDCTWTLGSDGKPVVDDPAMRHKREADNLQENDPQQEVTILHVQWWEFETFWLVAHPGSPDEPQALTNEQFTAFRKKIDEIKARSEAAGVPFDFGYSAAKSRRKVYKQAFIGSKLLGEVRPPQDPTGFTWKCITGEPDETTGHWFGLVTLARDPQKFANLSLSQTAHILNSTAKGGIVAETDAFEDQRQAEATYARPDAITWAAPGAISKGKIMQKPGAGMAAGHIKLLEFAIASIRDCIGINLELLGLRDANQPGILEAQRKQAAMTILATLFDSLKRFRKLVGRARLQLIQRYLATSKGRMVLISGEEGYELIRLLKQNTAGEYWVVVSDAPTSPNQKQKTFELIMQLLPAFRDMLTPEIAMLIIEFAEVPTEFLDKLRELSQKGPSPEQQKAQALAEAAAGTDIEAARAKAEKDRAQADSARAKSLLDLADAAARQFEGQLAAAQERIAAQIAAANEASPDMPDDAPIIEAPAVAMPGAPALVPPAMPAPAETPPGPELPIAPAGAGDMGRVI